MVEDIMKGDYMLMSINKQQQRRKGIALMLVFFFALTSIYLPVGMGQAEANVFSDLPTGHWARDSVNKMNAKGVIKGYSDNTFKPNNSITRLETIVMVIRLLGLEAEATSRTNIPVEFVNPQAIPAWGKGHIALAVERGILADADLRDFRHNDAAKRHEVATFLVRAVGLNSQAVSKMNSTLSFKDAAQIPAASRGYMVVANERGFMSGDNAGNVKPLDPITRAEMAAMLTRVDGYLDTQTENYLGTIKSITNLGSSWRMTVRLSNNLERQVDINSGTQVFVDNIRTEADQLQNEMQVRVFVRNNQATSVSAIHQVLAYEGIVKDVNVSGKQITIEESDKSRRTFAIPSDLELRRDNKKVELKDIKVGDKLNVQVYKGKLISFGAVTVKYEIKGVVKGIAHRPDRTITVELADETVNTYTLDTNVTIRKNRSTANFIDINIGDEVELEVLTDKVTRITATSTRYDMTGVVKQIILGTTNSIVVSTDEGKDETYSLTAKARILRNNEEIEIFDLRPGDYLELSLDSQAVTRIIVLQQSQQQNRIEGIVKRTLDSNLIEIEVVVNNEKVNQLILVNADTEYHGLRSRFSNLRTNDKVFVTGHKDGEMFRARTVFTY